MVTGQKQKSRTRNEKPDEPQLKESLIHEERRFKSTQKEEVARRLLKLSPQIIYYKDRRGSCMTGSKNRSKVNLEEREII